VDQILKRLRKLKRSYWAKLHGGLFQTVGLPDIIGCYRGKFIAIEVKCPGKEHTLTERQKLILKRLSKAGARTGMATNIKEALNICRGNIK
jgi:Holliday junction resolvase